MVRSPEPWHFDKRVPLALIFALLAQTAGMVWWASSISSQVQNHGEEIARLKLADTARLVEERRVSEGLARMDERLKAHTEILQRLERALTQRNTP